MEARRSARIVVGSASLVVVGAIALSRWIASREWFTRDDFAFPTYVQRPESWSWAAVYRPWGERFWPVYRPLGMETFFWVGFRLFGLESFGYFATPLALHFAAGGLARRSLPERRVAPFHALLAAGMIAAVPWAALVRRGASPL